MVELAHSELGPSASERWIECPGSVLASRGVPDEDTKYNLEGSIAHELAETANRYDKPARYYVGQTLRVRKVDSSWYEHVVDEEMADAVQEFLDHVNGLPGFDLNEVRVRYDRWIPGGFGTLDRARLDADTAIARIRDLKYGVGVKVSAKGNPQMRHYAIGLLHDFDWLYPMERFNLGVVQPRLDHYEEEELSRAELLDWFYNVAVPASKIAMQPGAPFKAGEWCTFCRLRRTCVTRAASVFAVIPRQVEFSNLDEAIADPTPPVQVATLTPEQIARILDHRPAIKSFLKDIEDYAMREVQQRRPVGDYKLVAGRSSRAFSAPAGEVSDAIVAHTGVLAPTIWTAPELKSVAVIEKLVGKKRFKLIEEKYVKRTPGRPTLAPGSDSRPALEPGGVEFSNLDANTEEV